MAEPETKWFSGRVIDEMDENQAYQIYEGVRPFSQVTCKYVASLETEGWDKLEIYINQTSYAQKVMKMAGKLEGYIMQSRIDAYYNNVMDFLKKQSPEQNIPDEVYDWIAGNLNYIKDLIQNEELANDPYVQHVEMLFCQFLGLLDGWNYNKDDEESRTQSDLWFLMCTGDLIDVIQKYIKHEGETPDEKADRILRQGRCSALIKLTEKRDELFLGHNTWYTYGALLRVRKTYHFVTPDQKLVNVSFSSYPGVLVSMDDFYVTSQGLGITETTISAVDDKALDDITDQGLPSWMRVMIANIMSTNGTDWINTVTKYPTGTYNDQYAIVDYNLFEPNKDKLQPKTVMLVELYPLSFEQMDITDIVNEKGYFPMFNVPFTDKVFEKLGYKEFVEKNPDAWFSLGHNCSRYNVFAKIQNTVTDAKSMEEVMRYNNYQNDEESKHPKFGADPAASIASRYDLRDGKNLKKEAMGALDAKITTSEMIKELQFVSVAGPTRSHGLPPLDIEALEKEVPFLHEGVPTSMNWDWIHMSFPANKEAPGKEKKNYTVLIVCVVCSVTFVAAVVVSVLVICMVMRRRRKNYSSIN